MRYPISTEAYITAMRRNFGPSAFAEEACREIIPLLNAAYEDGLNRAGGYPLELNTELQAFAEASGRPLEKVKENHLLPPLIRLANAAYDQGRKEAVQ